MKVLIVYASLTGNTEQAAKILEASFIQSNADVKIKECMQASPADFSAYDICVVATYTWGREGELPDEIVEFYEDLAKLDLSGKIYGTIGTGERAYNYFCKSADDFDNQFKKTNAVKGAEVIKIELMPQKKDINNINLFVRQLISAYNELKHKF